MNPDTEDLDRADRAEQSWRDRQCALDDFQAACFGIMREALAGDLTPALFEEVRERARAAITLEARREMTCYTREIEITVSGFTRGSGWLRDWWREMHGRPRFVHKHLNIEVIFNPYRMSMSAWMDPERPGEIICFA